MIQNKRSAFEWLIVRPLEGSRMLGRLLQFAPLDRYRLFNILPPAHKKELRRDVIVSTPLEKGHARRTLTRVEMGSSLRSLSLAAEVPTFN
eukprot:3026628-Amphidinium_carterae.1